MFGWPRRHDLRDTGPWNQFLKDLKLFTRRKTPLRDIFTFILACLPIVAGIALLVVVLLLIAVL